ncbi:hypothetical protein [Streptomyces himalayensis]|uniref:hypothetical protein n=1 Tax=Streptomyces himalayensis TaxID=2820085 RepID=UPI001C67B508|nr:hypothetical protein [Streptomyces himalayensis]
MLVTAPLVGAGTAHAQYPPGPGLTLTDTTGLPGQTISYNATGLESFEEGNELFFSRVKVLGTFRADAEGNVSGTFTIPRRAKPGLHVFELVPEDRDPILAANITVIGRGKDGYPGPGYGKGEYPHLADTGSDTKLLITGAAAAGLIVAGAGTLVVMRRRTRS